MFKKKEIKIPVEVSARHCHLSKDDLEKLFGKGYELHKFKQLSQPADFACAETVTIKFGSKKIEKIRIVGPLRNQTQAEISMTDARGSGMTPPIKLSGNLNGSAGVTLYGPVGEIELSEGLIIACRHLHCSIEEAQKFKLKTGDVVSVKVEGERGVVFDNVIVRVKDDYKLCLHLDTDEGNTAGVDKLGEGKIIF